MSQEILYQEEQGYVGLYFEPNLGYVMTVELHQWSVSELKRYLIIFGKILNDLKDRGITVVYGLCRSEKKQKFTEVFGFKPTYMNLDNNDNVPMHIMRLEL